MISSSRLYDGVPTEASLEERIVKLVLFELPGRGDVWPGVLTDQGVVNVADAVRVGHSPQLTMQGIIDDFDRLRPELERRVRTSETLPLSSVRLRAPLARAGKSLARIADYWDDRALVARPRNMVLDGWDAVSGRGDTLVPELVESATTIMTLTSGGVIACGTNHEGLGPLQDGEVVDFEIHGIGRMQLRVRDPLTRSWEKGIYMGADSTNPEAVKRNRPQPAP